MAPKQRNISLESLQVEDADIPAWFYTFLSQLNNYMSDAGDSFDQLTTPNVSRQTESVTFTTDGSGNLGTVKFKNRLPSKPMVVLIGKIVPDSGASTTITVGQPVWRLNGSNEIEIQHIGGLSNNTRYSATFISLPE